MTLEQETQTSQYNSKVYPKVLYYGKRILPCGDRSVFKKLLPDGEPTELSPIPSQKLYNHSPGGFEWGYGGSGPAQLALALLLDVTTEPETTLAYYQQFKWDKVSIWGDEWSITRKEILDWLKALQIRENLNTN